MRQRFVCSGNESSNTIFGGIHWDDLAGIRRMRQRGFGGSVPATRYRVAWRIARFWSQRSHDGLRHWTHLRLSPEPRRFNRSECGRTISVVVAARIYRRSDSWWNGGGGHRVCNCEWRTQFQSGFRSGFKRIRRAFSRRILAGVMLCCRSCFDVLLCAHHPGFNAQASAFGICSAGDRSWPHFDPPHWNSSHECLGESGAQYRSGNYRGRLGCAAVVAVLAGANSGSCSCIGCESFIRATPGVVPNKRKLIRLSHPNS
jgi:hypothetical protein